MINIEAKVYCT